MRRLFLLWLFFISITIALNPIWHGDRTVNKVAITFDGPKPGYALQF